MNNAVTIKTGPSLVEQATADICRDAIAEQLHFAAVQIACARMYLDINDDAGLFYSAEAGRVHYRAALEAVDHLKRQKKARAA